MLTSSSYKSKQFWWLVLKLIILIFLGIFIYHSLANQEELSLETFSEVLTESSVFSATSLIILVLFSSINWILEITKWKVLSKQIEPTSWKKATEQSLSSLSFSLITPNRIGEYGAKALYYKKQDRKNILILNFIGNFHQLIMTLILGTLGIIYLKPILQDELPEQTYTFLMIAPMILGISALLLNFNNRFLEWRRNLLRRFDFITKKLNRQVFLLSLGRYLVFSHQFYFLITAFNFDISYWNAMAAISSMYLISSAVPMLSLFDFVVKGSIAVMIFSLFGISPMIILSIATLMWILNFVIPAIFGSYYVLTFSPVRS